jgi:hypothetical protein
MAFGIQRFRDIRFVLSVLDLHVLTEPFKKPHGFLKSKFVVEIGTHFLQEIKHSMFDFGPPRGLFVLILTAVSLSF